MKSTAWKDVCGRFANFQLRETCDLVYIPIVNVADHKKLASGAQKIVLRKSSWQQDFYPLHVLMNHKLKMFYLCL